MTFLCLYVSNSNDFEYEYALWIIYKANSLNETFAEVADLYCIMPESNDYFEYICNIKVFLIYWPYFG